MNAVNLCKQKYTTRHDWMAKVILLELRQKLKLKFDQTAKRYTHKPESVVENETDKKLLRF